MRPLRSSAASYATCSRRCWGTYSPMRWSRIIVTKCRPIRLRRSPPRFEAHGVTFWNAAPTMIVDVLASAGFRDSSFARLKVLTGGGAAMPAVVAERLKARFNLDFIEGYGMTETMSPTHINPLAAPKRQCLGIPVHETDARVIDPDTLEELSDAAVGEIIVHGPQVLQGYWKKPDANASSFIARHGNRFLPPAHLRSPHAERYSFALDRLKRII